MLQEAKDLQLNAVAKLVELSETRDNVVFKAPTGSGKTYMMADFMNRILQTNDDVIFLVSARSKSGLAQQNYDKFCEYRDKGMFTHLNPHLISSIIAGEERLYIPTDRNIYILPSDLNREGGRLMQGALIGFLDSITLNPVLGGYGKTIYLIKDESHIATTNLDNVDRFFSKSFYFSATPKLTRGQIPDIEISNSDAVSTKLIKNIEFGKCIANGDEIDETVGDAITKFESIKAQYRNLLGVNPCLIIQISNKNKAEEELQEIYAELNKPQHIDLKWMLIVDDPKKCDTNDTFKAKKLPISKWKDYAKSNTASIDIIIFKMVITEGWDIPRACMLYQIRDTNSVQLDEQVMGRVRRNPRLLDFESLSEEAQKLATTAWIWGIVSSEFRKTFGVRLWDESIEIQNSIKVKVTRLKKLEEKVDFNLKAFLDSQPKKTTHKSVFDIGRKFALADFSVQQMCLNYIDNYEKWWQVAENIEEISKENNRYYNDYTSSMEIKKDEETGKELEVSFPTDSYYTDNGNYQNISDWVWKRKQTDSDRFSFDSEAERVWATILMNLVKEDNEDDERVGKRIRVGKRNPKAGQKNLFDEIEPEFLPPNERGKGIYLWGKNYIGNSPIKFEYYMGALHSSYPDFIMKDNYNRIHIFEVKSLNVGLSFMDNNLYIAKIAELKKCYKQASKLTKQIFYLPIQQGDDWQITQYLNGEEKILTRSQFEKFVKNH
ncbi:MAG TPA: DEAD/DEAH box helicase family protein [Bacilli bacterium]|nr:DEAD/DEAH box helicase family protein [Bacilli bacterium]